MPLESCTLPNGKKGTRFGASGKCYADKADAEKQMRAIEASKHGLSYDLPEGVTPVEDRDINAKRGCLMAMLPESLHFNVKKLQDSLDPIDVVRLEDEPHVTVKYGFDESVTPDDIKQLIGDSSPVKFTVLGASVFHHDDNEFQRGGAGEYDVLKLDVFSECLRKLNAVIVGSDLPIDDSSFPVYHPHMTLAYLHPGSGERYEHNAKLDSLSGLDVVLDHLVYSSPTNERTVIPLAGDPSVSAAGVKLLSFCATGIGGGVDPSCPSHGSTGPTEQQVKAFHDAVTQLPKHVYEKIKATAEKRYAQLEKRYGPKYAKAIIAVALAAQVSPIPGTSLVAAAPVLAVAEMHRRFAA